MIWEEKIRGEEKVSVKFSYQAKEYIRGFRLGDEIGDGYKRQSRWVGRQVGRQVGSIDKQIGRWVGKQVGR